MSGREIESSALMPNATVADETWAKAAVKVAGGLAFHHPEASAQELASDPLFADDLIELLDAVGYLGFLESAVAAAKSRNTRLKGAAS